MAENVGVKLSYLEWILASLALVFGFLMGNAIGFIALNIQLLWPLVVLSLIYACLELLLFGAVTGFWRLVIRRKGRTLEQDAARDNQPQSRLIRHIFIAGFIGGLCIPMLQALASLATGA
ncbi:hypothetical protein [Aliiroseovarius sediminis]|uniref:hypothetical protein n=1 Tax=Aliiroseovarius sediminis TaxID=2925839 RepID=UPI001F57BF85|nr:hypothetical protein [Aliiroseovarius sediminis]MCI2394290.1 hypothetical protein [Aliiroseovarius sediminis]